MEKRCKTLTLLLTGASGAVTWVSGDKTIASVDSKGVVTGKKAGRRHSKDLCGRRKEQPHSCLERPSR